MLSNSRRALLGPVFHGLVAVFASVVSLVLAGRVVRSGVLVAGAQPDRAIHGSSRT